MKNSSTTQVSLGAALVSLSALGYATNPIFGKVAYQAGATPITLLAIRFTLASLALWATLAVRRQVRGVSMTKRAQLLVLGALGMGMVSLLYFTALEHIGASFATGLFYTYPVMVSAVGVLRGEAIGRAGLAGLALTLAGTWFMIGTGFTGFTWGGAVLILASAVLYSAFIVVGEVWTAAVPPAVASAHMTGGAALVFLLLTVLTRPPVPGGQAFVAAGALALCSTILALVTFFAGLPKVGPARAAIISTLEPVFTTMMALLFLGERLSLLQGIGIGLVVVGAVAAQLRDQVKPAAKTA